MTPQVPVLGWLLATTLLIVALGMSGTLVWAFWQILLGRPVLPRLDKPARLVPWGIPTLVFEFLLIMTVYIAVPSAYVTFRDRNPPKWGAQTAPDAGSKPRTAEKVVHKDVSRPADVPKIPQPPKPEPPSSSRFSFVEMMGLLAGINGLLLVLVPIPVRFFAGASWADLGLSRTHFRKSMGLGVLAFFLITPLVIAINGMAQKFYPPSKHPLEKMLREELSVGVVGLAYLSAVVLAPLAEELIFRGLLQSWLHKILSPKVWVMDEMDLRQDADGPVTSARESPVVAETPGPLTSTSETNLPVEHDLRGTPEISPGLERMSEQKSGVAVTDTGARRPLPFRNRAAGSRRPILITSILFAAAHWEQMPAPIAIFVLSLMLGRVYERTGNLFSAILLHALFNGFNTTLLLAALVLAPPTQARPQKPTPVNVGARNGKHASIFSLAPASKMVRLFTHHHGRIVVTPES